MDSKIPSQLKGMSFNRVLLKTKKPFEKDWTNKPYTYEEISKHFPRENYGVMTGHNQLGVLDDDSDDKILIKLFEENFQDTFKVREHEYIKLKGWDCEKIIFYDKEGKHLGELQGKGQMVVGAGSIHPSGEIYDLKKDVPIIEVEFEKFKEVFKDYIIKKQKVIRETSRTNWEGDDIKDIPISAVISFAGLNDCGDGCLQGSHPDHGSDTGMNFRINTLDNTWYCFRCGSGGSSPELIAVINGVISCSEAGRGCLAGDKGSQVIKIAREKYGLRVPEREEKVAMGWALSVNIRKLAERYDFTKCIKCNLEFDFNEKLGFFKCNKCGDFGGLKIFADMILNNYNKTK